MARGRKSWLYFVPVFNVFYDMWFDSPPGFSQINDCMSTFGLIAGLMVTVAQAVMNTMSSEDSELYKETNFANAYTEFAFWAPTGFALLSAAMLAVVVHYLASSCSDVEHMTPEVYRAWWVFVRGNIAMTFGLTVMGLTGVMLGAMQLFILQHSSTEQEADDLNRWTRGVLCGFVMGGCGVSIPWVCMSLGLVYSKHVEGRQEEVAVSEDVIYTQLKQYQQTCRAPDHQDGQAPEAWAATGPEQNFFYMQKEEFLEALDASLGPNKSMTEMSKEFAVLAFDTFKDEQMRKRLRVQKLAE